MSDTASEAIELEANRQIGILPLAGAWFDQDPWHVTLIRLAAEARSERETINRKKASRKAQRRR